MAMLPLLLAVVIDAAPVSASADKAVATPPHTYLHPPADGCDSRAPDDEIVVCGTKELDEQYRLRPSEDARFAQQPVRAEMKLGKAVVALRADPRKADDAQDDVKFTHYYNDLRLRFAIPF